MALQHRRGGHPIAVAILILVISAVLTSTLVLFVVTYNGPPPMPMPTRLDAIASQLTGREIRVVSSDDLGPFPRKFRKVFADERRNLTVVRAATPPSATLIESRLPAIEARLARMLGTTPDRVIVLTDRQLPFLRQEITGEFTVAWHATDGWRVVRPGPRPWLTGWHKATLLAMFLAVLALGLPAWFLARAITRPLRKLAVAAEAARAGAARPTFPRNGPSEVRALTEAVATMHDRLAHHAEARTRMLASIAHDLGTPLARLSFWIEQLPDTARERATRDIDEMRAMISDTLAFARDESGERDSTLVELSSLLDSLVEDMQVGGHAVSIESGPRLVVRGDPRSLRRAIANLIGNAVRYGDQATVRWRAEGERAIVSVEDEGPGFDATQAERLFDPFVRGEASRNRSTGGTGLGLAIVRSIAARHGGSASLTNRAGGGGLATLTLPIAR